ncbi:MAG TPA: tryptophan synthase subunit alpha [Deltaproteobacteria bacterium]|nr:tryptophan synthase subunit alpha [Deltaproteobacteria bacterium]HPR53761.1 tryptophan synthase subunit alpha [Deltaproteobacteria bacterium]HXK46778.1 tryptophan synthase subunit alpha [Deltaproteobacteria bacterium]
MIAQSIRAHAKAVIPYVTAGLPNLDLTGRILLALQEAGAAAVEIGIPFSDPMADGPVLQKASHLALQAGFRMDDLMQRLKGWSTMLDVPLIVMSYINPLMRRGLRGTLARLKEGGVDGVIIPDLPRDADRIHADCRETGLDLIRLLAPTTVPERAKEVLHQCSGFVYAVSVKGVTGQRTSMPEGIRDQVASIKALTDLPVCVGFGVSRASQVSELLGFADGVIVGSYIMQEIMEAHDPVQAAQDALRGLMNGGGRRS